MAIDLIGIGCVAAVSSYLTLHFLSPSEPFIDEDGEEEYTLSSYIKISVAYVIKCALKKGMELLGFLQETKTVRKNDNVIYFNPQPKPRFEEYEEDNDDELVV